MERLWYIKHCRLFEQLTPDQTNRLERAARLRTFPKNASVYLPSDAADGVFLLAEGRVKLCSLTSEGKEAILAFIDAGELFGELALLGETQREEHASTVLPSTIILLPRNEVEEIMAESARLSLGVSKLVGWRRKRIERRLKNLLFRSNRERLCHLLLDLVEQYGRRTDDGVLITIKLSHQDLASIIGSTRETVTVLLGELQLDRLITVVRRRLVIKELERLADSVTAVAPNLPEPTNENVSAPLPLRDKPQPS